MIIPYRVKIKENQINNDEKKNLKNSNFFSFCFILTSKMYWKGKKCQSDIVFSSATKKGSNF